MNQTKKTELFDIIFDNFVGETIRLNMKNQMCCIGTTINKLGMENGTEFIEGFGELKLFEMKQNYITYIDIFNVSKFYWDKSFFIIEYENDNIIKLAKTLNYSNNEN